MGKFPGNLPDTGGRHDVRAELERIFAARQFARSPVMRGLLAYLVEQSIAGNGLKLKAYTIAVDALGRPPTFDAQSDSYPRVQVGRLRRLLDEFYEVSGRAGELRIAIPKGAYAVTFEPLFELQASHVLGNQSIAAPAAASPSRFGGMRLAASVAGAAFLSIIALQSLAGDADAEAPAALTVGLPAGERADRLEDVCPLYRTHAECAALFGGPEPSESRSPETAHIGAGFSEDAGS